MLKAFIISEQAKKDLSNIFDSVSDYTGSVTSAAKLREAFFDKFELIRLLPKTGKQRNDDTRETFCRHYRVVYREFDDRVEILTVIHSRRKYPQ
ncbi:type II toxin-antitoxin system RelE/ParE family toxin [Gallibacterium anatis]|uniref:Type II toxin-antitoxin system RelE/ParE family toxin n=1 Tax=Gallibacterium anatis TaxID=750 RepID=A0AAX3XE89_9PAST|nr:type II toxin-antitoxin system RelE/ParE family toxin [Gallibacterium anatis]MDK9430995.1 type II toxin-antitoxin system RelE/ParE family toxin [Gallibacterium anatis]WIM80518.1 type II toxin-antitoxin system RelE/ParE family toxin [Gallibacterium anatis]